MATRVMQKRTVTIREALAAEAYEWLVQNDPLMAEAIGDELVAGKSPEDIKREVSQEGGPDRYAKARRCYLAATWLSDYGGDA